MQRDRSAEAHRPASFASAGAGVPAAAAWYLETEPADATRRRIPLRPLPFRVGRDPVAELVVPSHAVSKLHAEIYLSAGELHLKDLGSTNGTFVDYQRIEDAVLDEGAVLHFADFECRVGRGVTDPAGSSTLVLPRRFAAGTAELQDLLREEAIEPLFQPIVPLAEGEAGTYEALARGRHPDLPEQPEELFCLAVRMGKEAALSRLCRHVAIEQVADRTEVRTLFLNTHPSEVREPGLLESLAVLRERAPQVRLLLEMHESALADTQTLTRLKAGLLELGIGLVYDDFGAGQARLIELAEVPPDYLKFDIRFVRGIDEAPASKRRLLKSLLDAACDLNVRCVAEGVETQAEADACADLGFTHAQGYLFGRPRALDRLAIGPAMAATERVE